MMNKIKLGERDKSHTVTRREFLRASAQVAASVLLYSPEILASRSPVQIRRRSAPKKIIVVGSGLAGLCTGHELVQAGHDVTILEARARSGGRILTLRESFADGLYADAGAARIHSSHDHTLGYVRRFNLPLVPFYPSDDQFVHFQRGATERARWREFARAVKNYVGVELERVTRWFKIEGGNDRLPHAFAAQLENKILYNAPVTRFEQDARGVRVMFRRAGGTVETLAAERVVCAVPFTMLRRIEIAPAFSPAKQRIVETLSYDSASRVFLQFRRKFWEGAGVNGFAITDQPAEIWPATYNQASVRGILQSYTRGSVSEAITTLSAAERANATLQQIERIFPGGHSELESSASVCWSADEWARGAWAHPDEEQLRVIRQPETRIHFAGEHTSEWSSWMQGALESGLRAAREVNDAP